MIRPDFVDKQWRASLRMLKVMPFVLFFIVGYNSWRDYQAGRPFDWVYVPVTVGFLLFLGFMYVFMRLIFKFVRAKAQHDERPR